MKSVMVLIACFLLADLAYAGELDGLWQAKRRYGPDIRGTLLVTQDGGAWQAEIAAARFPWCD